MSKQKNPPKNKRTYLIQAAILSAGIALAIFAYSPPMNPPQCEGEVHSGCIVGANIGAGLVLLPAILLIVGSLLAALITYTFSNTKHSTKYKIIVLSGWTLAGLLLTAMAFFYFAPEFSSDNWDSGSDGITIEQNP